MLTGFFRFGFQTLVDICSCVLDTCPLTNCECRACADKHEPVSDSLARSRPLDTLYDDSSCLSLCVVGSSW